MADEPDFEKMSPEEIAEYQRQNCIFCKIIKGEIPSKKVYDDGKIVAILDINPAAKGHLLIMTKEHYPVLPVIPAELSAHMFRITRDLSTALKKAMITDRTTIFMANGGAAGQQSPHFLYHMIPREGTDGLDNFIVPSKEVKDEELTSIMPLLRGKLGLFMRDYYSKVRKVEKKPEQAQQPVHQQQPGNAPINQQALADIILNNPQLRDLILNNPEGFKAELEKNPDLKKFFSGVDISKLSEALGKIKGTGWNNG